MTDLYLYSNCLTGTIPSELISCSLLQYLYLQDNNLEGSMPTSILTLLYLQSIDLSGNQLLGGNITSMFSSNTTKSLRYVVMSSMSLTGSLPSSLFNLSNLKTLVLSLNCITGTLSSSICESTSLSSLILDGVGVGSSCSTNRGSRSSFHGYIPSCLFSMPSLSTLHLTGNGLTGTLPELSANSSLTTLSLTSNRLTGIYLS
jgi:Leucine-rich repeat (LRR) protein